VNYTFIYLQKDRNTPDVIRNTPDVIRNTRDVIRNTRDVITVYYVVIKHM